MALKLSDKWDGVLKTLPESGMGYTICTVVLNTGFEYKQVVIQDNIITQIRYFGTNIPFSEEQIIEIVPTHDRWDFKKE